MEGGNSLEQAVALVAAANRVVQDPNSVGSALRTISLRLRGTSVEILEEMGEETEGVIESTSKLQKKIKALSGVDILTDSGDYKDTYTILKEIGQVWEDMSDIDQAALLELMAGKNRANTLSAILSNMTDLKGAYESALDAEGSAMKENEAYLDSIQGRIDLFNNSVQAMWMNFIDSDVVKFIVDLGTGLIKLIDNIGLLEIALAGVFTYFNLSSESKLDFASMFGIHDMENGWFAKIKTQATDATNASKTLLSVLKQVDTMPLQQVATDVEMGQKIDTLNQKFSEGQESLVQYISGLGDTDIALKAYVASVNDGNYSLAGFQQFIQKHNQSIKQSGIAAKAAAVGHQLLNAAISMGVSLIASFAIDALVKELDSLITTHEELIQQAEELENTYASQSQTLKDNTSTLQDLEDEFSSLSKGVDKYGNNISLTADEYERYKEICEKIVGINPSIASGYDDVTEAIGNNASALSDLIKLQKEQARIAAKTQINDENLAILSTKAIDEYNKAKTEYDHNNVGLDSLDEAAKIGNRLAESLTATAKSGQDWQTDEWDLYAIFGLEDFYDPNGGFAGNKPNQMVNDYYKEIYAILDDAAKKGEGIKRTLASGVTLEISADDVVSIRDELGRAITNYESEIVLLQKRLSDAQEGLINTLLITPLSHNDYDKISGASKNFLTDWIKKNDIFKITEDTTTDSVEDMRDIILGMIDLLADETKKIEFNGQQITAQDLLDQMYNLDPSTVDWNTYQIKVADYIDAFWNLIGGENNKFGFKSKNEIAISFGFNFVEDRQELAKDHELIRKRLGVTVQEMDRLMSGMNAAEIQAFYKIDWNDAEHSDKNTIEEVMDAVHKKIAKVNDVVSSKTYSVLVEGAEKYNEILAQTSEVVADNTEVTQEYKDSLIALGISEDELNEYFYKDNKLVVKNAKGLNNLVKATKKNVAQNVKLAKSHARLEYYELYKEMRTLVNGTKAADRATLDYVNSLYKQMNVLQRTIAKYSVLEAELLGAANAYQELEDAQAADEAMDYGSKAEELVNVLAEAFNTAQLGTEAARVAIEGIIPDDVIDKSKTLDEQMQQVYSYFTGGPVSKLFTLKFDDEGAIESIEMTKENIQTFTEGLIGTDEDSVFLGSWDEFTLNPAIKNLEDFAKAIGTTKEVAFAYLTELERYDIGNALGFGGDSLLDQLMGDNLDYQLQKAIQTAAEVEKKLAEGTLKVTDAEYKDAQKNLEAREEQAITSSTTWLDKQQALEEQKKTLEELEKQYEEAYAAGEDTSQIEKAIENTSKEIDLLLVDIRELEEPTEFVLNVAASEAKENIAELKSDIDDLVKSLKEAGKEDQAIVLEGFIKDIDTGGLDKIKEMGFTKGPDGKWHGDARIKGWTELDGPSKQKVLEYIGMIEDEHQIDLALGEDTPTIEETIQTIAETLERIANILDPNYTLTVETADAEEKTSIFKSLWDGITSKEVTLTTFVETVQRFFTRTPKEGDGADNVNGTAHISGTANARGSWGAPKTETSLVGELGPEILVRGNRWTTVGENGAEFTQVRKGDIIFNHKQSKELLKNGYVTGRGKAYASGTAYASNTKHTIGFDGSAGIDTWDKAYQNVYNDYTGAKFIEGKIDTSDKYNDKDYDGSSGGGDAEDEFEEVFDWIEVRLEEINEKLNLKSAELENAVGSSAQNEIIDKMIEINEELRDNLLAGANEYYSYASKLLSNIPEEYRDAAANGAIAIEEFVGEVDEETLKAIQEYREWVQKGADATQQAEEVLAEIQSLAKQAFDNIVNEFENKLSFNDTKIEQYEAHNDLLETDKGFASADIYQAIIEENKKKLELLEQQRAAMQAELDSGKIEEGTDAWYEAVNAIAAIDTEITNVNTEIENLQDSINALHWAQFDLLMSKFQAVSNEAENLLDILATKDAVDEFGNWTNEGITSLGLLAQQMEAAEMQAAKYQEEIEYLNANWEALGYTEEEYLEKLEELKSGQYDAINSYNDAKDAILELNKVRVDAIKEGIEKEIEAYQELIEAKKEALDAERDLHDFQKSVLDQQKNIADIERQLAALSNDNSASARAKRAKLEAELAEAKAELEETYYDRSVDDQQDALDKELENFEDQKEKEIEGWEKYLESVEAVVADSLAMVQENTQVVYAMLASLAQQYGLDITSALTDPWLAGTTAIQDYGAKLNISLSELASMFNLTVDEFAAKLGLTTETLVGNLGITASQMAESLGMTNEQLAAALGLTVTEMDAMMDLSIQELAAQMGLTLPALAEQLGTTTAGLAGNLDMTMSQFAGSMGLTVEELAEKFGLTTEELAATLGMTYGDLMNPFGMSMSATIDALKALEEEYRRILAEIQAESQKTVEDVNNAMDEYQNKQEEQEEQPSPSQDNNNTPAPNARSEQDYYGVALAIWNGNYGWGVGQQRIDNLKAKGFDANKVQQIVDQMGRDGYVRSGAWVGRYYGIKDLSPYHLNKFAKGSISVNKDQWAILDELGDELQLVPDGKGRLSYIKKGTGIVPADMTSNLMSWGALDPQDMLDRNRPNIMPSKSVINTEINLDCSVGTLVNIERCDQSTLPDVEKLVNKAFDKHMQTLNNSIRRYTR